ncbi:Mg2+ and Co2+ transporter [Bdellovibrio bacteriovorus]|uniref:Mg2+ and Co2+ transporter n=1 Tax=Bdellovibrio bacteriovorus TaxID=959 RepID=A0A150WES2_BDEBC|nr:hemolysin family protein [Bdellovibrio bacteriovorus]KYG61472.1 Mg2+ and Co2+ transporter [Bdellovibrio bacteriovorus]
MTIISILFFLTIGISFLCSLLEAVLLSSTSAYIGVLVKENKRSGKLLEHLKENLDRPISAILTLNTFSHTLGSAAIAYQVQVQYGEESVTLVSFVLTFLILILSEIIPKSIGAAHWKALVPFSAYAIQFMILLLYPLVIMSEWIGRFFAKTGDDPEVTREEILMTAEIGMEEGTLKGKESNIIKNLLMLDKIYVSDIMTPRSVFFALEKDETVEEVFAKHRPLRFSRIPIYAGSLDNIVGMTYRYKIHEALSNDQHDKLVGDLVTPISSIPERMTVSQVLDFFIKEKEHVALAVDEYGIVAGLVSLEDAVETLLGVEIVDELDNVEDMRKFALEQWQLRKQKLRRS